MFEMPGEEGSEMNRARDIDFHKGRFIGGITWYPYQIALGVSLRFFLSMFSIRIHIGAIKIWIGIFADHHRAVDLMETEPK